MRAFTADPVRAKDELGAAAMLFRFLVISEQHLTSKQIAQCNTVIAMLDDLIEAYSSPALMEKIAKFQVTLHPAIQQS